MRSTYLKILLSSFLLVFLSNSAYSQYTVYEPLPPVSKTNYVRHIADDIYIGTVFYLNLGNTYNAKYTLKVTVISGRIVKIDFGKGGSIHTGYNNEGYIYSGGDLIYKRDDDYDIVSASSTITIFDKNMKSKRYAVLIQ